MEANIERIERLLALMLLHDLRDAPQSERARALSLAAFSNSEIADLLGTTAAVIGQQLYETRKKGSTKRKNKKAKK